MSKLFKVTVLDGGKIPRTNQQCAEIVTFKLKKKCRRQNAQKVNLNICSMWLDVLLPYLKFCVFEYHHYYYIVQITAIVIQLDKLGSF